MMDYKARTYIVNNISLPYYASVEEAFSVSRRKFSKLGLSAVGAEFRIHRRSIDARRKDDIRFVYSVSVTGDFPNISSDRLLLHGMTEDVYASPQFVLGEKHAEGPVVVVGAGPAGLFSALILAEAGFRVILIERGGSVAERKRAVSEFEATRVLDPSTNIQFGAGGAGTFSDGKLVTRINDALSGYILRRLVDFGAPDEILYIAKPHIGTDVLSRVVDNIINRIISLGGEIMYHTAMLGFEDKAGNVKAVLTNNGPIECAAVIMAIGHSARDTYDYIIQRGMQLEAKSFSVGMRIEHSRSTIDSGLYGRFAGDPLLPPGEYNLSHNTKVRGVYTFCMCPGGEVVAATSEIGGVVTNGMSHHARDGKNSNSAICCTVFKDDYGATPLSAIDFQRRIERAAFRAGGSDYSAPIITVGDFLDGRCASEPTTVSPTYMGGHGVRLTDPALYLPDFVTSGIKAAILNFDTKLKGFASRDAILTGPETRTSAPVRILRDTDTRVASGFENLYPAGEGAGYAGGITSAAIDGIKCAMALMKKYRP